MLPPDDLLAGLEGIVRQTARRILGDQATRTSHLARRVIETSRRYTVDRGLPTADLDPAARLLFFTLADLPKLSYPLAELAGRIPRHGSRELRILDVGAGHGAQTLGLLAALDHERDGSALPVRIQAVDRDARSLEILEQVLDGCREGLAIGRRAALERQVLDLERYAPGGEHDLVLVGSVLNELSGERRIQLVLDLLGTLAPRGHLILLEPALRETARELHRLRDRILELRPEIAVLAPCTHNRAPCPMLASESDWCHERRPWTPPPGVRALARATGLRRGDLKWSYLTLARSDIGRSAPARGVASLLPSARSDIGRSAPARGVASLLPSARSDIGRSAPAREYEGPRQTMRVVSDPLPSKGKLELFLCGGSGRVRAVRLNRHRSPSNRPFQRLRRGWLVRIEGAELEGATLRLGADTEVTAEDPAARSS